MFDTEEAQVIQFQDFIPQLLKPGSVISSPLFGNAPVYEPLSAVLERANAWLVENRVRVVNVETVLLPMVNTTMPGTTQITGIRVYTDTVDWHQFIRLWYEVPA